AVEEAQYSRTRDWHFQQAQIFRREHNESGEHMHLMFGRFRQADVKRFQHEREIPRSGKDFWQTHDIESWAKNAHRLNKEDKTKVDFGILMAELPSEAIPPLWNRVRRMQMQDQIGRAH